ncbi:MULTISPECIES: hypothetical protein [unclassified Methylobacterium]|jgi:hypothetical protein|uniref:hypothetical protein n=1 Tax=unclassified Methylobacterium TaxID=2615210 RepID=UPI001352383E|nr:hypothetical protein [Methylobacterium sp. 2A]MWV23453.1 hypothetical protein [Methylobacterium sp. 2A]
MSASQEAEKLTGTWINNLSIAVIVAGVVAPASRAREVLVAHEAGAPYVASILLWLAAGYGVHLFGRSWLLRRYRE